MEVLRAINNVFGLRPRPLPVYYINPFRDEQDVLGSIMATLRPVPVLLASEFRPKQIKWLPQQPGSVLVSATVDRLKQEVLP
jgi:hypothetical protein